MRLKSHWFGDAAAKSPQEHASAMAFIVFRVARHMLDHMRGARFDIDAGPPYFAFLREALAFLIQVVDRMTWRRMDAAAREAFTTALALHVARVLAENEQDLLGPPAAGETTYRDRFVDLVNELADHYADFGADPTVPDFAPDFAFVRYFASRVECVLPEKDRPWAMDHLMAIEVPEAVDTLGRALHGLLSTEPRTARRTAVSGD